MTTKTKVNIASFTASSTLLLHVFSKPLHIPEPLKWVLLIGAFIPVALLFHFIKALKQEQERPLCEVGAAGASPAESRKTIKSRLGLAMALGCVAGLRAPFWLPLTGTTLGTSGDFVIGLVTAAIICVMVGVKLRRL